MKLEDFQNIDWNDFSAWPFFIKTIGVGIIAVAILVAGFWFIIQGEIDEYNEAQKKNRACATSLKARRH